MLTQSCFASIYIHFFQLILWPLFYHGHFVSVFNGKTNTGTLRLFTLSYILCRLLTSFAINPWILLLLVLKDSSVQFLLLITIFNCIVDTSIQQKIKLYWTFFTHVITQRSHTQQMMINKWYTFFKIFFWKALWTSLTFISDRCGEHTHIYKCISTERSDPFLSDIHRPHSIS